MIIFFAALTSVLYYWGILQWVVKLLGGALQFALRTSKAESTFAASTIFVGMSEAPLVVKPYIERATKSELFTMMGTGLATVAGSLLVGYSLLGVRLDYLIAAAFMAGPAGIVMSKIIVPETGEPETLVASGVDTAGEEDEEDRRIRAPQHHRRHRFGHPGRVADRAHRRGHADSLHLAYRAHQHHPRRRRRPVRVPGLTFELILGYIFAPLAFVIGVPWEEAIGAGSFLGQKLVLNEFVAFSNFGPQAEQFSQKTVAIVTFGLTGFANFGSIAILIGTVRVHLAGPPAGGRPVRHQGGPRRNARQPDERHYRRHPDRVREVTWDAAPR